MWALWASWVLFHNEGLTWREQLHSALSFLIWGQVILYLPPPSFLPSLPLSSESRAFSLGLLAEVLICFWHTCTNSLSKDIPALRALTSSFQNLLQSCSCVINTGEGAGAWADEIKYIKKMWTHLSLVNWTLAKAPIPFKRLFYDFSTNSTEKIGIYTEENMYSFFEHCFLHPNFFFTSNVLKWLKDPYCKTWN